MRRIMKLATFDANTCSLKEIKETIDEQGYVILLNALDVNQISELKKELEPYFENRENSQALFFGYNTKRIEALFSKSREAQAMATHKQVLSVVDHVLGENCQGFQINLTQGIRINPGEKAQALHPDSALYPISNKPFEFVVNAMWAYSDFKKENGATQIVPGSHKWSEDRQPEDHEIHYAEMPAGSVLIYAASLLHGGGNNIDNSARTGIAISYCLGWLRQSENQYLSYSTETVKTFSNDLQQLIGYNVHRPNLGWVNGHDPKYLLSDETPEGGAEDFLTPEQEEFMIEYHKNQNSALTSHNLKVA